MSPDEYKGCHIVAASLFRYVWDDVDPRRSLGLALPLIASNLRPIVINRMIEGFEEMASRSQSMILYDRNTIIAWLKEQKN